MESTGTSVKMTNFPTDLVKIQSNETHVAPNDSSEILWRFFRDVG